MYEIRPESVKTFITDKNMRLPRFQRKQTWGEEKNFQLCISLFKEYPIGVSILSIEKIEGEKNVKWLLDGRQRKNALSLIYEDPEKIYFWARKFIGFKDKDKTEELEDKYWQKISEYIESDSEEIKNENNNNLLVGLDTADDAAVYKLNDETALIQTLDFFTPMIDDPYIFGQIAAANSLSDVYAMGGKPIVAMNIVCFPSCHDMNILAEILKGGFDKVKESGALLVGGHTVDDKEPKYGLSISGIVHPEKVLSNATARVGDKLILTKPIGVGILNTAMKENLVSKEISDKVIEVMVHLNKYAAKSFDYIKVNSVTDITGFGLLGHALEMAKASNVSIEINSKDVPILDGAIDMANMGIIPAGMYRNKEYISKDVNIIDVDTAIEDILYDPQTSGGLLISVKEELADKLVEDMKLNGSIEAKIIGSVKKKEEKYITVI